MVFMLREKFIQDTTIIDDCYSKPGKEIVKNVKF
jgi:hypothetical protein